MTPRPACHHTCGPGCWRSAGLGDGPSFWAKRPMVLQFCQSARSASPSTRPSGFGVSPPAPNASRRSCGGTSHGRCADGPTCLASAVRSTATSAQPGSSGAAERRRDDGTRQSGAHREALPWKRSARDAEDQVHEPGAPRTGGVGGPNPAHHTLQLLEHLPYRGHLGKRTKTARNASTNGDTAPPWDGPNRLVRAGRRVGRGALTRAAAHPADRGVRACWWKRQSVLLPARRPR